MTCYYRDVSGSLTEPELVAAFRPRHEACKCPLCEMDRRMIESMKESLFGNKL